MIETALKGVALLALASIAVSTLKWLLAICARCCWRSWRSLLRSGWRPLAHDPEKLAPHLMRGGTGFRKKIMLQQEARAG